MVCVYPKKTNVIFQKSMSGRQVILRIHRERDELPQMILIIPISVGRHPDATVLCPINISGIYMRQNRLLPDTILIYIINENSIPGGYPKFRWRYFLNRFNIMSDKRLMMLKDILQLSAHYFYMGSKRADPHGMPTI